MCLFFVFLLDFTENSFLTINLEKMGQPHSKNLDKKL